MRVSIFYSEGAGDGIALHRILETIEDQGHRVVGVVEREDDAQGLLDDEPDVVVAAGGDGTVAAAARVVAGRQVPLAILPLGTANNIARSTGCHESIEDAIRCWNRANLQLFDLGVATASWGRRRFLEGVGAGLVSRGIEAMHAEPDEEEAPTASELAQALWMYRKVLMRLKPQRWRLNVDGMPVVGDFLMVEVLNIPAVGPNLVLSSDATPSDGWFSVVMAEESDRETLADYLRQRLEGSEAPLSLPTRRAQTIEIHGAEAVHLDDTVHPLPAPRSVTLHIEPGALQLLV